MIWLVASATPNSLQPLAFILFLIIAIFYVVRRVLQSALATKNAFKAPVCLRGRGTGMCIFCPGLGSNVARTMKSCPAREMLDSHEQVVFFDYTEGSHCIEQLVDDAMDVVAQYGLGTIAGHSMGGTVALHVALRLRKTGTPTALSVTLFASPCHTMSGISLDVLSRIGVLFLAGGLDMSAVCRDIGAGTTLRIVHARDDDVISFDHALEIAESARLAGMDVHLDVRSQGGHQLTHRNERRSGA